MDEDLLSPETRLQLRLQRIETTLDDLQKDLQEHRDETRLRLDAQDKRQERILWSVISLILTVAGVAMGAVVTGILPS